MKHCNNCYVENVPLFIATCSTCYDSDPEESVQCQSCIDARRRVNNHLVCVRCHRPTKVRRIFGWTKKLSMLNTLLANVMTPHDEPPFRFDLVYVFASAVMMAIIKYATVTYFQQSLYVVAISELAQFLAMWINSLSGIRRIHYRTNTDVLFSLMLFYFLLTPCLAMLCFTSYFISSHLFAGCVFLFYCLHIVFTTAEFCFIFVVACIVYIGTARAICSVLKKIKEMYRGVRRTYSTVTSLVVDYESVQV